jgi:3-methyl-2-oxobutanoate hydroxymethyltransferase
VIEGVKEDVARMITEKLRIPTIGIGASPACDGQVLVIDDMLGISVSGYTPSFVKQYAQLGHAIEVAASTYADEVKARAFPSAEYCFPFSKKATSKTPQDAS